MYTSAIVITLFFLLCCTYAESFLNTTLVSGYLAEESISHVPYSCGCDTFPAKLALRAMLLRAL